METNYRRVGSCLWWKLNNCVCLFCNACLLAKCWECSIHTCISHCWATSSVCHFLFFNGTIQSCYFLVSACFPWQASLGWSCIFRATMKLRNDVMYWPLVHSINIHHLSTESIDNLLLEQSALDEYWHGTQVASFLWDSYRSCTLVNRTCLCD